MPFGPVRDVVESDVDEAIRHGRYELNEAEFIRRAVRPGDSVIDVGANVGVHTVLMAALVGSTGEVMALEPCRAHVAKLSATLCAAGLDGRVNVISAAAGDRRGPARLLVAAARQLSHQAWLVPETYSPRPTDLVEQVHVIRIDDLPHRGRVTFMKVDVEGSESLVLAGAWRLLLSDRPVLLLDLHPHLMPLVSGDRPADCIARLAAIGYRCHLLGAGVASMAIADTPTNLVTPVVFLPDDLDSGTARAPGR
jgi:FkbM family methyltransferase